MLCPLDEETESTLTGEVRYDLPALGESAAEARRRADRHRRREEALLRSFDDVSVAGEAGAQARVQARLKAVGSGALLKAFEWIDVSAKSLFTMPMPTEDGHLTIFDFNDLRSPCIRLPSDRPSICPAVDWASCGWSARTAR